MLQYKESPEQFFQQLEEGCLHEEDIQKKYACLSRILKRAVDQQLIDCKLSFAGLFAKISYLIKERNIPEALAKQINETRMSLRSKVESRRSKVEDESSHTPALPREGDKDFSYDLKAVVQFIAAIYGIKEMPKSLAKHFPAQDRKIGWKAYNVASLRVIVNRWDADYIYVTESLNATDLRVCYTAGNKYLTLEGKTNADYLRTILFESCQLNLIRPRFFNENENQNENQNQNENRNSLSPEGGAGGGFCCPELIIFEPDFLIDISTIAGCFESYATSPYVQLINKFKTHTTSQPILLGNFASQFLDETVKGEKLSYTESAIDFFRHNALSMSVAETDKNFHANAQRQKAIIQKLIGEDLPREVSSYNAENVTLEPSFFCERLGIQGRMDFLNLPQPSAPPQPSPSGRENILSQTSPREGDGNSKDIIIIEQKSGKGAFVSYPSDPQHPLHQEKHYVQLLLYRALMQYGLDIPADNLQNLFLLYSKYEKGLLRMGPAPELLHKAIDVRNQLVWCEMGYTKGDMSILKTLTPEKLNKNKIQGKLWDMYVRQQILDVLMPFQQASPLEQKYFLRMVQFLETEHLLNKIGNRTKENSGFASKWQNTLEEKQESGDIVEGLKLRVESRELRVESRELRDERRETRDEKRVSRTESIEIIDCYIDNLTSLSANNNSKLSTLNFREGDIVILYPYEIGTEPDCCKQMVFRASIVSLRSDGITLRLRNTQTAKRQFIKPDNYRWAIEHDLFESSMNSQYQAMQLFLNAPKHRRDLLLLQRQPEVDTSKILKGDYGKFNDLQLRAKQAKDYFIIIGPPGTGKTSYGMLNLVQEELLEKDSTILITSYTNRAVDEICSKLIETGIDFLRIGSPLSCAKEYHDYLLDTKCKECKKAQDVKELIQNTRIICATTSTLNNRPEIFILKSFSLCVIDEASQILEPQLVGLLSACHDGEIAIKKFVMIGDHKQLPAVVQQTEEQSIVEDEELKNIHLTDCRRSLFERLLSKLKSDNSKILLETSGKAERKVENSQISNLKFQFVHMLTHQGRMHRRIAEFPNREFYGGKLDVVPLPHQIVPGYEPVTFINVSPENDNTSDKVNLQEAEIIAEQVLYYYDRYKDTFDPTQTIGVIVPYRNQITAVRNAIAKLVERRETKDLSTLDSNLSTLDSNLSTLDSKLSTLDSNLSTLDSRLSTITIDTVERYQGSQRDVIIYGFTIKKPYQLNFLCSNTFEEDGMLIDRKLNVAMTRARKHLVMVGNAQLLSLNVTFRRLLNELKNKK